jgi:DNA-binding SARP family transcriptional activator
MRIPRIIVRLFGIPSLLINDVEILTRLPSTDRELLCYLVLFRARRHRRESLATLLWGEQPPEQSRKHLRQTLWRLHEALAEGGTLDPRKVLPAGQEWVQFAMTQAIWLDLMDFESTAADGLPRRRTRDQALHHARWVKAADLYRGDLLEGWASEWCLPERERYRQLYMRLVDAVLPVYEVRKEFDRGIVCAMRSLEVDPAREASYRALMRLLFQKGDRTAALRAYERCVAAIQEEFGVTPEEATEELVAQIRAGRASASRRKSGR